MTFVNRLLPFVLLPVAVIFITAILSVSKVFVGFESIFLDSLFTLDDPSKEIVIVAIDDVSTMPAPEGLGRFNEWSRSYYSEMLESLKIEQPKVVAMDLIFDKPTVTLRTDDVRLLDYKMNKAVDIEDQITEVRDFINTYSSSKLNPVDLEFADTLEGIGNMVLAGFINFEDNKLNKPLDKFLQGATVAFVNVDLEDNQKYTKSFQNYYVESEANTYDSFALAVAKLYLDEDKIEIPVNGGGQMYINYFGDPYSYQMVPFVDVVNGDFPEGFFKDKIVLVGLTSERSIQDTVLTPRSNSTPMPGVEAHANAIQTIIEKKFLVEQGTAGQMLTVLGLALVLTFVFTRFGIVVSTVTLFASLGLYYGAAHFFYRQGLLINIVNPMLTIVLTYIAAWVYRYFVADKGKRQIKSAFGHYVSKELVEEISKNPDQVKLGGEKRVVSVLFSDLKNSTGISEKMEITAWVSQINEYFTLMETVIQKMGGTLDKYEGDAIMAFWNAPLSQGDHVLRAFAAALEMKKALRDVLYPRWQVQGKPLIEIRVGINVGEAIVGNFGSVNRFDYTVMGDTVNTASRLESSANKAYGTELMVAGFQQHMTTEQMKAFVFREIDRVLLPGKESVVQLYELMCFTKDFNVEKQAVLQAYLQGLQAYYGRDFATALRFFESLPGDAAARTMVARCKALLGGTPLPNLRQEDMAFAIVGK